MSKYNPLKPRFLLRENTPVGHGVLASFHSEYVNNGGTFVQGFS
jgi:hypothetical protein